MRIEKDLIGDIQVPDRAYFGAQTQRAVKNFPLNGEKSLKDFPEIIHAMMMIKKAAAILNEKIGKLDPSISSAIQKAADKVLENEMYDQFPIHHLHGGGGTSANMNANEVLANLAEEIMGGNIGEYKLVHPNDHVNLHQSTNDVYPSACHIAIILKWPVLKTTINNLIETLQKRAIELKNVRRLARTCLQDAVDITFSEFLSGYIALLKRSMFRINEAVDHLHTLNLGGTIVGRKEDAPEAYQKQIAGILQDVLGNQNYSISQNLFDMAQNPDELAAVSSSLALLAQNLIKIGQDFRLIGSGPESGLNEIVLPAVQPGSSIMPGKINPVIPEFLIQSAIQVIGNNTACQMGVTLGELDLNVWESLMVFSVLNSMNLLSNAIMIFDKKCVQGFLVNVHENREKVESIIPLLTRLMHKHGYSKINKLCEESKGDNQRLRYLLEKQNLI